MDEKAEVATPNCPWEIQTITDDDFAFRQVPVNLRETHRTRKIPTESSFALRPNEDSLSFNLKAIIIDVSKNFKLMSITHTSSGKFVEVTAFKIFEFQINFLKTIGKFEAITHTPQFHGAPSPIGKPNNKSHLSLFCGEFNEGSRVQLKEYCMENDCECQFDINSIREEIAELRARSNDTPYHNYWEF